MPENGVLENMKKRLLIAGGSGLIGSALAKEAGLQGWETTILSRHAGSGRISWDPTKGTIDLNHNDTYDAIINLTGASISEGRWTEKKKKEIYASRVDACQTLEKYMRDHLLTTSFYLGISGIGIYGERGAEIVDEETPIESNEDWLIKTTLEWESGHRSLTDLGVRTVIIRTGIVLSMDGGALKEILNSPGFGVLAYFGNGKQIWSWIHMQDLIRMIFFFIDHAGTNGTYIASSPYPVTNKDLIKTANQYLSPKRIVVGVPKIIMALMLGEMHRILFESCPATSAKIEREGFQFNFPSIDSAMRNLLKK